MGTSRWLEPRLIMWVRSRLGGPGWELVYWELSGGGCAAAAPAVVAAAALGGWVLEERERELELPPWKAKVEPGSRCPCWLWSAGGAGLGTSRLASRECRSWMSCRLPEGDERPLLPRLPECSLSMPGDGCRAKFIEPIEVPSSSMSFKDWALDDVLRRRPPPAGGP